MTRITVDYDGENRIVTLTTDKGTWTGDAVTLNLALLALARKLPDDCDDSEQRSSCVAGSAGSSETVFLGAAGAPADLHKEQ